MNGEFVIGVDVGTGSVRVGLFDLRGRMVSFSQKEIQIWKPKEDFVEQSSTDIWSATCFSVRDAVAKAGIAPESVIGISYDATCSLVALDLDDHPVTVSPTGNDEQNVVVWMDHRALKEAERINAGRHRVLRYVGGRISPEMEIPKLLWLKRHLPATWKRTARYFDLADFMTYRSTGADVRSLCTTVCKWTYLGDEHRWDATFLESLGLSLLIPEEKIGTKILPMGTPIGRLTAASASELGLTQNTVVAVGIIDAHAGGLGVVGITSDGRVPKKSELEKVLALIGGTSSCHMAVSRQPRFIPGVWGPYASAMIPGMWLTEGGQSSTGSLLDFVIRQNGRYQEVREAAEKSGLTIYQFLNTVVQDIKRRERKGPEITRDLNILPYFHGNRSPRADATLRGVFSGLTLDESIETVARAYYATIQAIAYGTRHIIETMNRHGHRIQRIHACGGGTKNQLWLQEHSDITGCEIQLPKESEAVLVGSAVLAAVGAGKYSSVLDAAKHMSSPGERFVPDRRSSRYHAAKYKVFLRMYRQFVECRRMLAPF